LPPGIKWFSGQKPLRSKIFLASKKPAIFPRQKISLRVAIALVQAPELHSLLDPAPSGVAIAEVILFAPRIDSKGGLPMARKVFHSLPDGNRWKVESAGKTISTHRTQKASEKAAVNLGHKAQDSGGLGQAVLHKSNGTIREERTYGNDPRRYKG